MIWTVQNSQQLQAIGEIELGSDRVIGIVAGALVEQRLEISLKFRLNPHEHTLNQSFKPTGPLGPFKNKIDLDFLLTCITNECGLHSQASLKSAINLLTNWNTHSRQTTPDA
jgi:hypothetical protein